MANNDEFNGEDFSQDVNAGEEELHQNGDNAENGDSAGPTNGNGNVSAEAPGRDDDRWANKFQIFNFIRFPHLLDSSRFD